MVAQAFQPVHQTGLQFRLVRLKNPLYPQLYFPQTTLSAGLRMIWFKFPRNHPFIFSTLENQEGKS
jgi:hypothetical protein